jgi:hypothetical protein
VPADPQSKGGSEATVRIARADLVPTDHNLPGDHEDFAALEAACVEFCERGQRARAPDHAVGAGVMLAEERACQEPAKIAGRSPSKDVGRWLWLSAI